MAAEIVRISVEIKSAVSLNSKYHLEMAVTDPAWKQKRVRFKMYPGVLDQDQDVHQNIVGKDENTQFAKLSSFRKILTHNRFNQLRLRSTIF